MAVPVCWTVFIFGVYSIPGFDLSYQDPWKLIRFDKLAHSGLFAILVLTLITGFRKQTAIRGLRMHAKKNALIFAVVYGGVLELYQGRLFVERSSDIMDFIANVLGALLGLILFRMIYGRELAKA